MVSPDDASLNINTNHKAHLLTRVHADDVCAVPFTNSYFVGAIECRQDAHSVRSVVDIPEWRQQKSHLKAA